MRLATSDALPPLATAATHIIIYLVGDPYKITNLYLAGLHPKGGGNDGIQNLRKNFSAFFVEFFWSKDQALVLGHSIGSVAGPEVFFLNFVDGEAKYVCPKWLIFSESDY